LWIPYTIVDVGWWYQLAYPRLPSGRVDYAMTSGNDEIIGDGNMPTALTDLRDIGRYMAMIISDPRTLNKKILAYNLVSTQNKIYELMEELSEEKIDRNYVCCTGSCIWKKMNVANDFSFSRSTGPRGNHLQQGCGGPAG
jgi:hypothetical protein